LFSVTCVVNFHRVEMVVARLEVNLKERHQLLMMIMMVEMRSMMMIVIIFIIMLM